MNFFQRRSVLKNANFLELTPIAIVHYEIDSSNNITLLMPKVTNRLAKKYFEPMLKSPNIKLKLDELGSASWLKIDGKKKVSFIAEELRNQFGEKIHPVEERLTKFLSLLYEQKLITYAEIKGD